VLDARWLRAQHPLLGHPPRDEGGRRRDCSRLPIYVSLRSAVRQKARETYPGVRPRIITENGSQFVAKDFKAFDRHFRTTHVLTSPHDPQSNGKIERFPPHLKEQAIRPKTSLTLEDAQRVAAPSSTVTSDPAGVEAG